MTYNKSIFFNRLAPTFNAIYKNVSTVESMPNFSEFNPRIMHYLRQAFYYELYGLDYADKIKKYAKLPIDQVTNTFVHWLNNDTYDGLENSKLIPIKMSLYTKDLWPDDNYDMTNIYTNSFKYGLANVTYQLNTYDDKQKIYTLDALFSDYAFNVDSTLSGKALEYSNYLRSIQQRINNFTTQPGHMQIAYKLGLLVPNGYDNQRCTIFAGLHRYKGVYSLLRREISLVYQQINGWSPMDIVDMPIINPLPFNKSNQWCYDALYALNHYPTIPTEEINKNVSQADLNQAFDLSSYRNIHNLSMKTVCHLTLDSTDAVQAFYLNKSNPNNYKIHSVQMHTDKSLMPFKEITQTIVQTGTFNPNEIDSTFHMPNCVLKDNIALVNHKPLLKSEQDWTETDKINANLVAHTQTLAPVGHDQFLIGIYGSNDKYKWAQAFGLFDLSGAKSYNYYSDISKIPYLIGFNAYRLEATTDLNKRLLIIQTIQKDGTSVYYKYDLDPILKSMLNNNCTNINNFKPLSIFKVLKSWVNISSYQGFAYNSSLDQVIISSQRHPDQYELNDDKTIFLPKYEMPRALYMLPLKELNPYKASFVSITNLKNTSLSKAINNQMDNSLKPITYATELEGIQMATDTSLYQLCVYHWSDKDLVKQDNSNVLMQFYWNKGSDLNL